MHELIFSQYNIYKDRAMRKTCLRAYASAQFDQGLRSPLTESLDTIESMNVEPKPG